MKVLEIFNSIDGEGIRAGELVTFIRLAGCNLRCPYCDTKYSWDPEGAEAKDMTPGQIYLHVMEKGYRKVTLTGGEPLWGDETHHKELRELISLMTTSGIEVNIETNGSIDIEPFRFNNEWNPNLFFTVDYKCPSSKMENKMCMEMFSRLHAHDVLKFVVGSVEDLDRAREVVYFNKPKCHIFVSPVFGQIEPAQIVDYMQEHKLTDWRIQLQMHKFIWDPDMRGV